MKTLNQIALTLGVASTLLLAGCGTMNQPQYGATNAPQYGGVPAASPSQHADPAQIRRGYGVVHSLELVRAEAAGSGGASGLGAVAGAVVGGLVGSQIGSGSGRTAATIAGVAGGAYVGHQIENRQPAQPQQPDLNRVTVRMNDGSYQAVMQGTGIELRVGDRVWVDDAGVRRY